MQASLFLSPAVCWGLSRVTGRAPQREPCFLPASLPALSLGLSLAICRMDGALGRRDSYRMGPTALVLSLATASSFPSFCEGRPRTQHLLIVLSAGGGFSASPPTLSLATQPGRQTRRKRGLHSMRSTTEQEQQQQFPGPKGSVREEARSEQPPQLQAGSRCGTYFPCHWLKVETGTERGSNFLRTTQERGNPTYLPTWFQICPSKPFLEVGVAQG